MKEYKEDFIHPKTKEKQSIPVYEYSFEDWENGTICTNWKPGKRLTHNLTTKQYEYEFLPFEEKHKIITKAKELYIEKVQKETDLFKSLFELRYSKSEAKDLLLKNEIELYQKLLSNELLPIGTLTNMIQPLELVLPFWNMPFPVIDPETKTFKAIQNIQYYSPTKLDTITINSIREIYKQIIIEGNKDYSRTEYIDIRSNDTHLIRVEAIHNYIQYLNSFENNSKLLQFTALENSGKRNKIEINMAKNDKFCQNFKLENEVSELIFDTLEKMKAIEGISKTDFKLIFNGKSKSKKIQFKWNKAKNHLTYLLKEIRGLFWTNVNDTELFKFINLFLDSKVSSNNRDISPTNKKGYENLLNELKKLQTPTK